MKKRVRKLIILAGVSILAFSSQSATAAKAKTTAQKPAVLGKMSMENWFGLDSEKLKTQVKGTKDIYEISEDGTKVLAGLEKTESWFGASAKVFYSLVTENAESGWDKGELSRIILTYNKTDYNTLVKNMTKSLGEPSYDQISNEPDTISEAVFYKGKLHYLISEYLNHVEVIIEYDAN